MKLDKVDFQILDFLQENASLTAKEMAAKLNITATPIYERIRKLERSGIIMKYVALLDPEELGYKLTVFMNICLNTQTLEVRKNFINTITSLEEVVEFFHTSGQYDYIAKVRFPGVKEYREFLVNKVSIIPNVSDIDSQIVLEEIKHETKVILPKLEK